MRIIVTIRTAELHDAPSFARAIAEAEQSGMMMFNPGERQLTAEAATKLIAAFHLQERSEIFVAVDESNVIGYLMIKGEQPARLAHRGYIVIGLVDGYRGQGIGTQLFEQALAWARTVHIRKLELTVIAHNTPAVKLYEKVGFVIEGTKKQSLYIDGQFVDELCMGIVL